MTPRLDSSPTAVGQDIPVDPLDVVATQGAYLLPPPRTPVWRQEIDDKLADVLTERLNIVILAQSWRRAIYHSAADEWPMGHTPPELKEKRKAELQAYDELEGVTSEDESDTEGKAKDKIHNNGGLPTPPLTTESARVTPHRRKRRKLREGTEEEHIPTKKHISTIQEVSVDAGDSLPNTARPRSRKRQRTLDQGDEEHGDKQRPSKVRATMARSRGIWLRRLRPRPIRPNG